MRSNRLKQVIISILVIMLAVPAAWAFQAAKIDYEKMDSDLRIMEKILNTMLTGSEDTGSGRWSVYSSANVKGAYLEDYGVVFMVPLGTNTYIISEGETDKIESRREEFKEKLIEFLSSYADAIKQVNPNDWITIVVNPSSSLMNYYVVAGNISGGYRYDTRANTIRIGGKEDENKPKPFILSVRKSDITAVRGNTMEMDEFSDKVNFSEIGNNSDPDLQGDIKIMRGILETVLEDKLESSLPSESVQGTYLKDYGVLFTVNAGSANSYWLGSGGVLSWSVTDPGGVIVERIKDYNVNIDSIKAIVDVKVEKGEYDKAKDVYSLAFSSSGEVDEEKIAELTDTMIEVLGDFGHTMRNLSESDQVSILFSSSGYKAGTKGNINLMVMVEYGDIIKYSNGELSLEAFKERVISRSFD
ncbi:hypothetical protein ACFL5P_00190 [candidate division KSB1 bacterium]